MSRRPGLLQRHGESAFSIATLLLASVACNASSKDAGPDPCPVPDVGPNACWDGERAFDDPISVLRFRTTLDDVFSLDADLYSRAQETCSGQPGSPGFWGSEGFCNGYAGRIDSEAGFYSPRRAMTPLDSREAAIGQSFTGITYWVCPGCTSDPDLGLECDHDEEPIDGTITVVDVTDDKARLDVEVDGITGTLWAYACFVE